MKTNVFPLNYFKSVWTPIQAFKNRHQLNWLHLLIVIIFLNGLMTIPVTLNYAKVNFYPLTEFYPNTVKLMNSQVVEELNHIPYINGEMKINTPFSIENEFGVIAGGSDFAQTGEVLAKDKFLLFESNQFTIKEENKPLATVLYTKDFSLAGLQSKQEVLDELSRQWFNQQRIPFVFVFSLMISAFLCALLIFITFGSALFLYFTKNSSLTSITTYKESVNLTLNLLTLPTVIAMIFSLIHFDVTLMVAVQNLGLVLMLFVLFYQTNFNDHRLTELESAKKRGQLDIDSK